MVGNTVTCVTNRTHVGGEGKADHGGGRQRRRDEEGGLGQAGRSTRTDGIWGYRNGGRIRTSDVGVVSWWGITFH